MSDQVLQVSDDSFETNVLQSEKPVLVDFWANWCGPCKAIAPVVEELANTYKDSISVAKMDIDQNPATPQKLGIRGIPTLILFKNGQVVDQVVGNVPREKIVDLINKA